MNADKIVETIENMDNSERIKTLDLLFKKYFDNRPSKEVVEAFREWYEEEYLEREQEG